MPQPGDVFRDYARVMTGNREWRVTDPNATAPGAWESLPNPILPLSVADLQGATRAELIIDFWGGHPGTQPRQFRFNGNAWITIPNLATVSTSRPNCFMQQVNFVVDVPLAHLVQGTNTLEGTSGGQLCNNFNWGQWGWYQVNLRVYYDAATKPHPTGTITSPASGAVFGENPTVTATASGGSGVARVDFFAHFDGYDPDGDGRYADWQASYHRAPTPYVWTLSEHVGSDSAAPYSVTWNTNLVPDQRAGAVKLVAHIRDTNGYVFVTNEVSALTLQRTTSSVRLYRAVNVPEVFWVRANQTKYSYFVIPSGDDLTRVASAQLLIRSWNARQTLTTLLVNSWVAPLIGYDHFYSYDKLAVPASALVPGTNVFTATSVELEHHGTEIMWPGPAMLVRYNTPPRPPTNLPALLGCNEPSGTVVVDGTGNGNDGVLAPGVTRTTSGRHGGGIQFSGTSGHVDLDVIEFAGSALTISLWAYIDGASATDARLFAKALSAATIDGHCVVALQDRNRIRFRLATTSGTTDLLTGAVLAMNAWNHVAVTYDGASMRIFINGAQQATAGKTGAIANGSNVPAWLGDNPGPDRRRFTGRLDEIRLYAFAQSAAQISADMTTPIASADTSPPSIPTNLVATAHSSSSIALSWTDSTDNAGVAFYRVFRGSTEIATPTAPSHTDTNLNANTTYTYTVRAVDGSGNESAASAPASATTSTATPPANAPWWNAAWSYRVPLRIGASSWARQDRVVDVALNFTALLSAAGQSATVDTSTLRVVEISSAGAVLDAAVPFQFDPDAGFNATTNARGTVVFRLTGATAALADRYYHVYFASPGTGATALAVTPEVVVTDNIVDEGQSSFRIATPTGTLYYHKLGGGFSSWVDTNGNDWLGYHATGGSAGNYRGLPNAVHPEGHFHPGATTSVSTLVQSGPLKATIRSVTTDNLWECTWEIYSRCARMRLLRAGAAYWFLYEGTPGGTLNTGTDQVTRSSGETTLASQSWTGDIVGDEWVYFTDPGVGRSLYAALHQNDSAVDSYWPMENNMTVFGFGRNGLNKYLVGAPKMFTIGLVNQTAFGPMAAEINSAYKDVIIQPGSVERTGSTPPSPPASSFVSDDFSSGALDTSRWTVVNPRGDAGVQIVNQVLRISMPGGLEHDAWTTNQAPRVMQAINDTDFEIEAKFESAVTQRFQSQGFIVQQDAANFLRFDVYHDGTSVRAFAASFTNGAAAMPINKIIAAGSLYYLRVNRTGSQWTYRYSYDGTTWTTAGSFSRSLVTAQAGVFAGNAGGSATPAFTAAIDYVFNTASPIVPEDPSSSGNTPPTITAIADQTITQGGNTGPLAFTVGDAQTAAGSLALTGGSSNPTLVPVSGIVFGGSGANRTVTVTPASGQTGTATITVTVSDGSLGASESFLLTVQSPTGGPAFASDDFSGGSLDTNRWTFVNPRGDASVQVVNKVLQIAVPGGIDHDVWSSGNQVPRVTQTVENGDFEVEAKFESGVSQKYQLQGFIVQQDAANLLRFNVQFDGRVVRAFAATILNGTATSKVNVAIAASPVYYLRVARVGSQWTFRYSANGTSWTTAGTFSQSLTVSQVGVFAGNAGGTATPAFTAFVDYVFNAASPIVPEDGG